MWAAEGTIGLQPEGELFPNDASFGELDGPWDPGATIRIETRSATSVLMAGATYAPLDAEREVQFPGGTSRGELNTMHWTLDGGAGYRFSKNIEVLGVARYYLIQTGSNFGSVDVSDRHESWLDVFLGLRLMNTTGPMTLSVRGEIGAGGSKVAWFGSGVLAYRVGGKTSIQAEYRILSTEGEVRTAEDLPWDVVQHGLGLGIGVGF
jgi:hypothetical protein